MSKLADEAAAPAAAPNRIRAIRKSKGMTLEGLAEEIDRLRGEGHVSPGTLSKLETGDQKLTTDWLELIARALRVPPADLLAEVTEMAEPEVGEYGANRAEILDAIARRIHVGRPRVYTRPLMAGSLDAQGLLPGDVLVIDPDAQARRGDAVLVQHETPDGGAETLLRRYEPPYVISNSLGGVDPPLTVDSVTVRLAGVVVNRFSDPG